MFVGLGYLVVILGPSLDYSMHGTHGEMLFFNRPRYLIEPLIIVVLSIFLFTIGYNGKFGKDLAQRIPRIRNSWNTRRASVTTMVFSAIGIISLLIFLQVTGGIPTSVSEASQLRRPPTEYLRWGVSFLWLASLIYWSNIFTNDWNILSLKTLPVIPVTLITVIFPIYTSSRLTLFMTIISHLLLIHYHRKYISFRQVSSLAPVIIAIASLMLGFRRLGGPKEDAIIMYASPSTAFFNSIGARNNGLTVIAHIYHQTGKELRYYYGETMLQTVVFPIPRAVWSGKPMNIGQVLGVEIYGQGVGFVGAGTPPTIIGELWLNFGFLGVLAGMFLFGVVARGGYLYFEPLDSSNPLAIILYIGFVIEFCNRLFMLYTSSAIIQFLLWIFPLLVANIYISGALNIRRDSANSRNQVYD